MSKLIVNEIEKYDAGQLTITTGTNVSIGSDLTVGGSIAGTLSTAAQTNITSVGTLSSLAVSGDVSIADKIIHTGDTNTAIRFPSSDTIAFETSGTEKVRITPSGNLGIGNVGSNAKLEVTASSGEVFRADASGGAYRIVANQSGVNLNGNVGVGELNPSERLHVSGNAKIVGASAASNTVLELAANNNSGPSNTLRFTDLDPTAGTNGYVGNIEFYSTDRAGVVASIAARNTDASPDAYLAFSTDQGGTLSEKVRILNSGGITFNGDSAAANALDDYEEGTWDPVLYDNTTGTEIGDAVYQTSFTGGRYTKVGNKVTLTGIFRITSKGTVTSGNTAAIGGFPFASANDLAYRSATIIATDTSAASLLNLQENKDFALLRDAVGNVAITLGGLPATYYAQSFSITYFTN